jgi:predicted ArsR family transcriptional regulator
MDESAPDPVAAVGALGDPARRDLYGYIRRVRRPVTRQEAAESVGISRKLAAFHLDKLVEVGLLRTRYDAPDRVRGVGRAPKLYEPAPDAVRVSIPERRHQLLAEILAEAVSGTEAVDGAPREARQAAFEAADRRGELFGAEERARRRPGRLGTERALSLAAESLEEFGFEPERDAPDALVLRNCPFHPLAAASPDLICGINRRFLSGYLRGLGADGCAGAVLQAAPDACCVRLLGPDAVGEDGEASEDGA